jgi:D-glycero-alpha-D-manno-heptose-7-phosphate kinase
VIVTQTPLRISFVGGGTDFRGFYETGYGSVVSTAIDKFVYVIIKERFDRFIRVGYSRTEMVESIDEVQHDLVREALQLVGVEQGLEIATMADIPSEGSGLGSSGTVLVGILHALHIYKGDTVTAEQLAQEACHIELDILKRPIGKQDQYIAAYGGLRHFEFCSNEQVEVSTIQLNERDLWQLNESLLLFYTGVTRKSADVLAEQTMNIPNRMEVLTAMRNQGDELAGHLRRGKIIELGPMLQRNWQRKKQLASGVSNTAIDSLYDRAMRSGASGCKIAGAGGGGFLLVCVPPRKRNAVREELSELRELPITLARDGSKVIFNMRR